MLSLPCDLWDPLTRFLTPQEVLKLRGTCTLMRSELTGLHGRWECDVAPILRTTRPPRMSTRGITVRIHLFNKARTFSECTVVTTSKVFGGLVRSLLTGARSLAPTILYYSECPRRPCIRESPFDGAWLERYFKVEEASYLLLPDPHPLTHGARSRFFSV